MPQIPWVHWPQFVAWAVLGFVAFSILGLVGVWTKSRKHPPAPGESEGTGEPIWTKEIPWYWFLLVYCLTVGLLLALLIRFVGS